MRALYRYALWILLTSCLLASGCNKAKDIGNTLGALAKVRAELIKKFGEKDVDIRLNTGQNRTSISVMFVNSLLNQKTAGERAKRAQETAEVVKQFYPSIKNVGEIWVGFMRVTTSLVIFHYSEMLDVHGFDNEARALSDPGTAPLDTSQPSVRYLASQDQTEISTRNILLEGTPEKGLTLIPHFLVAGDVNKIKPKLPDEVFLYFGSFSEKPKFPNLTTVVFFSDKKVAYLTKGQFSTSKIGNDNFSEFLYLKVPTAAFLKITSGDTVTIRLNEDEYTLTESQVLQLKRMSDYLKNEISDNSARRKNESR